MGWATTFCLPETSVSHLEPLGKSGSTTISLLNDLECLEVLVAVFGLQHLKELLLSSTLIAHLDPYSGTTCHPKTQIIHGLIVMEKNSDPKRWRFFT
jgi:hypothetical protein